MRSIGWRYESVRHSLAAKGVKTGRRYNYTPTYVSGDLPLIAGDAVGTAGAEAVTWAPVVVPAALAYGAVVLAKKHMKKKKGRRRYKVEKKTWGGSVPINDDFGEPIVDEFIDGKTKMGPWAMMTPKSFQSMGVGLGLGLGQRYRKVGDEWVKVEG